MLSGSADSRAALDKMACPLRKAACLVFIFLSAYLTGCASVPGHTVQEQIAAGDALVVSTLRELIAGQPNVLQEVRQSAGYVVMSNQLVKVPILGGGSGFGVAVNNVTGEKTFLQMTRLDIGGGLGIRNVRPTIIFQESRLFKQFIDGQWSFDIGLEASAKVGEAGIAAESEGAENAGFKLYQLTDGGISATFTANLTRVSPVELVNPGATAHLASSRGLSSAELLARIKVEPIRSPVLLADNQDKTFMDVFSNLPSQKFPTLE